MGFEVSQQTQRKGRMMGLSVRETCFCMCSTLQVQSIMRQCCESTYSLDKVGNYWFFKWNLRTWDENSQIFTFLPKCPYPLPQNLTPFCSYSSVQFSSVTQSCLTLCDPMNSSSPGLPVHHQLPRFTQTHIHCVSDAIQPSHPLSSPSPLAPNPSQHQSLYQWINSSHEVAKVLEFQL